MKESGFGPVRVNPNDILTVYPIPSSENHTNVLAWVETTKGTELMTAIDATADTAKELSTAVNGQTLGDAFFNSVLRSVKALQGGYRGYTQGSRSNEYNLDASGIGIGIGKGWSLKVVCGQE